MRFLDLIVVFTFLTLVQSQDDEGSCTCSSVMVMSKEEMKREISAQVSAAVSRGSSCTPPTNTASDFNISSITLAMELTMDKFYAKVERLVQPIIGKLATLQQPGKSPSHPASSCSKILDVDPNSPSGLYWLRAGNGSAIRVFCDMTRTCGGVTGGWMKVAELDMTDTSNQCPHGLRQAIHDMKRLCTRNSDSGGCSSVHYKINGIGYNEVCGKIIAYQYGTPDAIHGGSIEGTYIDGVSLTHGNPKQHIWSFIAAVDEAATYTPSTCPCTNRNQPGPHPPSFVGNDYFCDSGSTNRYQDGRFYNDPLWDGEGCGPLSDCCTFRNPPWFYKKLPSATGDNVEMRVCRDQTATNEDVLIEKVDIYVR